MKRHRVLHLRASNFVGGPENQLLRYAQAEGDGAWDILLGTYLGPGEGIDFLQAAETCGLKSVSLPASSLRASLQALTHTVRNEQIQLICAHDYKSDVLGLLAGWLSGIPVACFLRGWIRENRKVRFYEAVDRFALRFADRVVCLSPPQSRALSRRSALAGKIRIICNAIDVPLMDTEKRLRARAMLRERFSLPQDSLVVASAGRLSPEKGVGDFLEAVSAIGSQFPETRYVVFGDGVVRPQLESQAHSLRLDDRVSFVGFHGDLRALLPGLDLLVNPSLSEEMPNVVLEGMSAGVPVVATAVGGVEDIAGPDEAICLVPPGNPAILAKAIRELLSDSGLRNRLAESGADRVAKAFSVVQQRAQFHDLYREFLASPRSASAAIVNGSETAVERCELSARTGGRASFLSVIIPVRNEEEHIRAVLTGVEEQDYPRDCFEVLVVDGDSTDGTAKVVEEFARHASISVQLLRNPSQLSSAGRNVGARNARGEFVIFIDGHCQIPSPSLLRNAVELFGKYKADCLCRPQPLTMPGNNAFQDVVAHARATALGHARDSTIYTTNWEGPVNPASSGALYRRTVFERVGFFDERFDACEDVEFNFRVFQAGLRAYFSPKLAVLYQPRRNFLSLWKQMARYGQGRCRLIRKHPMAFSFSQMIPALFLAWLGIGGMASFHSWRVAELFLATLAVYFGVVLLFSLGLGVRHGWRHSLWAPVVYACFHLGLGAGFIKEFFIARWCRTPSWGIHVDVPPIKLGKSTSKRVSENSRA